MSIHKKRGSHRLCRATPPQFSINPPL